MRLGAARRGLLIVGAVLLVPWIWIEITAPVPAVRDDESLVFAPLTTIPLRSIGSSASRVSESMYKPQPDRRLAFNCMGSKSRPTATPRSAARRWDLHSTP